MSFWWQLVVAASVAGAQPIPTPIGVGPAFHPRPTSHAVARAAAVGRFRCGRTQRHVLRAHVEVFGRKRVVIVPAGIGIAPPLVRRGAFVVGGRCRYAVHTLAPTGVVRFDASQRLRLRDLFAVWGQPIGPRRLLSFRGRVRAYVGGRRWHGRAGGIQLRRHAEIVLEVGPYIPPHRSFAFPPGR